jgi:hypothetical protein
MENVNFENKVVRTAKDFKLGQAVRLKDDFDSVLWVAKHNGKKCLKMATCLGWRYFEPEDWNDALPLRHY